MLDPFWQRPLCEPLKYWLACQVSRRNDQLRAQADLWGVSLSRSKGVSTKGVSMQRPNFPYVRAFHAVVSKSNDQISP